MDHENTIYSMHMHQHLSFFMKKKRPRMAIFWSKIQFFGARHAFADPPPF